MADDPTQAEITLFHWRLRFATLVAGALVASALVWVAYGARREGSTAALGMGQHTLSATWDGHEIAGRLDQFENAYPPTWWSGEFALWLGNSQMHTVNQYQDGEQTAPHYASESLGWPTICLSLENGCLQEHLVVTAWAFSLRTPGWLVIPVVFDDLREDRLRPGLEKLATGGTLEGLRESKIGTQLADHLLATLADTRPDNVTASADSLEDRTEAALENFLGSAWPVWRARNDMQAAVQIALASFRNWLLHIDPTSKRRMIPVRLKRNMDALVATLDLAKSRNVPVLIYIAPLRHDPEPPYVIPQYEKWKERLRDLAESKGAIFADLDTIVPDQEWGTVGESKSQIDYMHFREPGHVILGDTVADLLRAADGGKGDR